MLLESTDMFSPNPFRVGLSRDFLDDAGNLAFPDIGLDRLRGVEYRFLDTYQAEYPPSQLDGFDVLISLKPRVTRASLVGLTRLTAIGRCGVGYDNVDLAACTEQDIAVYITPGGVIRPMAESVVLLLLALSHRLTIRDRMVRAGSWAESTRKLGREPRGRTLGFIGFGNIAQEVVRLLGPFHVGRFLAHDPYVNSAIAEAASVELVAMQSLLEQADFVVVLCPLTPETRGLIGSTELGWMKSDAVLINVARGPIVDEQALVDALRRASIGGAALDVFEREPLDAASPLIALGNVILTSHSIGWTEELFRDMGQIACEGALAVRCGEVPANVVNREVLDRPGFRRKLDSYKEGQDS